MTTKKYFYTGVVLTIMLMLMIIAPHPNHYSQEVNKWIIGFMGTIVGIVWGIWLVFKMEKLD